MKSREGSRLPLFSGLAGLALILTFVLTGSVSVQAGPKEPGQVATGKEEKLSGVIVKREADSFTMREQDGKDVVVTLSSETQVKEKKSNPFRSAKNYVTTQLLPGLIVEAEGRRDGATFVAEEIKFTQSDFRVAQSLETRVNPVEGRLTQTETRLTQNEQNAQRMSGQVDELSALSNSARGGAKAAQETADAAISGLNTANEKITSNNTASIARNTATNERISSLDNFEVKENAAVTFKVGSAVLSQESKDKLDQFAEQAKNEKGFVIEITGFASSDGSENYNRQLSQRRADAVVQYLAENHNIPLRRLITPFGFGEKQPIADNKTRDGRVQNRRVELKILVSRGLIESAKASPTNDQP